MGPSGHTCSLLADSSVKCWGPNDLGQLGNGSTGGSSSVPVAVTGLSGVTDISVGFKISCALMADTTLKCWGDKSDGTFGSSGGTSQNTPALRVNTYNTTQFANSYYFGWFRSTNTDMQMADSLFPMGYIQEPIFTVNGL